MTLGELALVLVAAMGWEGYHLHTFEIHGVQFAESDPDWDIDVVDEDEYLIVDVFPRVGIKVRWDYDLGDGWEHDILVEAISLSVRRTEYPLCLAGRRACPPEDCGGPWGYADLLVALANPDHPEHEQMREWTPPGFDASRFDLEAVNRAMRPTLDGGQV